MRQLLCIALFASAILWPGHVNAQTASTVEDCAPGAACATPLPVRVVIVTMFEIGEDSGDKPGEFQLWKERAPHPTHPLSTVPS